MKKLTSFILITLLALPTLAQQMVVEMSSSNQTVALDKLSRITFVADNVNIACTDGTTLTAAMSKINRIHFGNATASIVGDVNNDNAVDVADVTKVVSVILGSEATNAADVNKDGSVDVADVTKIVSIILGSKAAPARAAATGTTTLYVNNSNNTYLPVITNEVEEITFDAAQRTIFIAQSNGTTNSFATDNITDIAPASNNGTQLTYSSEKSIAFDESDATSYNEVVETIVTDELDDEYGDFIENFSTTKFITIRFTESGVTCNSDVDDVAYTITNKTHIVINSTRSKVGYNVTGTCSNGSLKIYSEKKFQLHLANLNITNPTGPAINIQSGKTVYLKLSSTNTLCDGEVYSAPVIDSTTGESEDQKGTLFSEGQIIFDGTGTLNITSKGGHAICSDDYIRVRSGNINIASALKDGFHTNDIFRVGRTASAAPTITINASGDGIDCGKGSVLIEAGKITINSEGEAINVSYEAATPDPTITPDAIIKGGYIKATTTGDKAAIVKTSGNFKQSGGIVQGEVKGNGSKIVNSKGDITFTAGKLTAISHGSLSSDTTTAGGFKSEGNITIDGGTIAIDSRGKGSKGFNCNGNITINGGDVTLLATAENFVTAEYDRKTRAITTNGLTVNGGNIFTKAYDAAINATTLNLSAGTVQAFSTATQAIYGNITQSGGWLLQQGAE